MALNWWNLKKNRCPQCNRDLMKGLAVSNKIMRHACGFAISEEKFSAFVSGQIKADLMERQDIIE